MRFISAAGLARQPVSLLLALTVLLSVWNALPARAAVALSVVPEFPSVVTPGETGRAASLTVTNLSDGADFAGTMTITSLLLVTGCSVPGDTGCNDEGSTLEPGVINLSPAATGRAGTACAGEPFDLTLLNPEGGVYEFAQRFGSLVLNEPSAGNALDQCTIDFTFSVHGRLSSDASAAPGLQTAQVGLGFAVHSGSGNVGSGSGSDVTSVVPPAPADFNRGGTDISVWRPATGQWFVSDQFTLSWGLAGDVPVAADYDGDAVSDVAIWRPSTGQWFVKDRFTVSWGLNGDVPVPADYNGDGTSDVAVWRPSTGQWFVKDQFTVSWGLTDDVPVPGDYDGDGVFEVAVWRPATGQWFDRNLFSASWGLPGDIPVSADYDGNGTTDLAVWRPSTGRWFIQSQPVVVWGLAGDLPVPADYNGDGVSEPAVFRDGQWLFDRDGRAVSFGLPHDVPAPLPAANNP
jgi:hypothetical protein